MLTVALALGGLLSPAPAIAGRGCQDPAGSAGVALTAVALAPLPGHTAAEAHAISPSGEVVGDSHGAGSTAVHWNRLGVPRALRPLDGDVESSARSISAFGWVAGFSVRRSGGKVVITAVVWDRSRRPRPLAFPEGFKEAIALGINLRGHVAGFGVGPDGLDKALRWDAKGEVTVLPALRSATRGEAHAIDENGLVAGDSGSAAAATGALWDGQVRERRPLPGDLDSEVLALNGSGEVVGTSSTAQVNRAVLWGVGGDPIQLPPLPGHTDAHAFGINASGTIVGVSIGEKGYSAVVWKTRQCAVFPILTAPRP
jgi:uncharacterized membrane protein